MQLREIGNDTVGRVQVGAIGLGLMTFDQTGTQPREQPTPTVRVAVDLVLNAAQLGRLDAS